MASEREHLEKLIFEVHGAEEGKRQLDKLREAEEKHAKSLKGLQKEAKASAKAEVQSAKERAKAQEEASKKTVAAAKVAGIALVALAKLAMDASAQLEEANGRWERSAKKAGLTSTETAKAMSLADARSREFGRGLLEARNQMSALLDASGNMQDALRDHAILQDIVATGDADATQALELLTKARKGEVTELIKLDGFNRDNIEQMNKMESATERHSMAMQILTENYAGAAKELKGTTTAMAGLKEAGNDLLVVFGDVGSGLIKALLDTVGLATKGETGFETFARSMRNFTAEAKEAATHLEALIRFRGQDGGMLGKRSFFSFVNEVDNEQARANFEADETAKVKPLSVGNRRPSNLNTPDAKPKKKSKGRKRDDGSGALATQDVEFADVWQDIWQEAYGNDIDAFRAAWEEKNRITQEAADFQAESARNLVDVMKDVPDVIGETAEMEKDAAKVREATVMAGIQGSANLAKSVIKDKGTQAIIDGGLEIAKAAGSYPDPVGMASHGFAAAQYFAMAAQAGVGGGAKSKMGGGGTRQKGVKGERFAKGGGGSGSSDREAVGRIGGSKQGAGGMAPVVLNIHTNFAPSERDAQAIADTVQRASQSHTGGFWGNVNAVGTGRRK